MQVVKLLFWSLQATGLSLMYCSLWIGVMEYANFDVCLKCLSLSLRGSCRFGRFFRTVDGIFGIEDIAKYVLLPALF